MDPRFRALGEVARAAASSHDPEDALVRGLRALLTCYRLPCGEVFVPEGPELALQALAGCSGNCPFHEPIRALARRALQSGRVVRTPALVAVPIPGKEGPRAVYAFARRELSEPLDDAFLEALAGVVGLWIDHAELFQTLKTREAERGRLLRRLLLVQEEERRRIGRELHDDLGAQLTAALLALKTGREEAAREQIRTAMATVRRVARALRPQALEELGLEGALRALLAASGLPFRFQARLCPIDPLVEMVAFRVLQEAITNALRHGEPGRLLLSLECRGEKLYGELADDGRGFDPAATPPGVGLVGMRERVEQLGGELSIKSRPGAGTRVRFVLPREVP